MHEDCTSDGSWSLLASLPEELLLRVLGFCSPRSLLRLEATCCAFRALLSVQAVTADHHPYVEYRRSALSFSLGLCLSPFSLWRQIAAVNPSVPIPTARFVGTYPTDQFRRHPQRASLRRPKNSSSLHPQNWFVVFQFAHTRHCLNSCGLTLRRERTHGTDQVAKGEQIWRQLLHEVWLRNPQCSHYGARRWWLCRAISTHGSPIELALPWRVCGDTAQCQLLRQLSYRESYKACLLDRERFRITDEELVTLRWSVDFCGMASYLPLADNLRPASPIVSPAGDPNQGDGEGVPAAFHRDGCYEDGVLFTRGSKRCEWVHNPSVLSGGGAQAERTADAKDTLALFPAAAEGSRHLRVRSCTQASRCGLAQT